MNNETMTHPGLEAFDDEYNAIVECAIRLREHFFREAKSRLEPGLSHIPVAINIKVRSANSVGFDWVRMTVRKTANNKFLPPRPVYIPMGSSRGVKTNRYQVECFPFLKGNMRDLVMTYERMLAPLREEASNLLLLRRSFAASVERIKRGIATADSYEV